MTSVPVNSEAVSSVMARPRRVSTSHSGSAPRAGLASIGSYTTAHARGGARRRHQLRPRPRLRCDGPRAGGRGGTRGLRAHHLRRRRRRAGPRRADGGGRERARPLPGRRGRRRRGGRLRLLAQPARAGRRRPTAHPGHHLGRHPQRGRAPLHSAFFPAKLRWLRRARPEVFRRAATWCGFGEYLQAQLTGTLSASLSMASGTGLLDQTRGRWDETMLEAAGIAASTLPRIDDTAAPGLRPRWAARWPALARVPWHPARGDGACSNVGSDCWGPGRIALNVGTSAALRVVLPEPLGPHPATPWGLWRYRIDATRALVGGATSEGGNVPAWCRKVLALPADEAALERAIAAVPPDGHHLTALPFFAGERSPGWRPVAGLSLDTGPV